MDCLRHVRLYGLLLVLSLPVAAPADGPADAPAPTERVAKAKPRKPRLSPTSLTAPAVEPDPAPVIAPSNTAAARLSPVLRRLPETEATEAEVEARLPVVPPEPETALTKAIAAAGSGSPVKPSDKGRPLPAQEEGQALARATAVPEEDEATGATGEEAVAKVENGVETGPMRLRVRKQALQMSLEIPF